jgi:ABC-type sulfate transport system permease component
MKGFINLILLMICLFMFLPMILLVIEHLVSGNSSVLQRMTDNIKE